MRTLYMCEVGGGELEETLEEASKSAELSTELAAYSRVLVHGVADHQEEIDDELNGLLNKYDLMRLAALDRNILRIGAYEIAFVENIPPKVSINEAIEIAKKYSTAESGKFINGVLGRFMDNGDRSGYAPDVEEESAETEAVVVEEETVSEDSKEATEAKKRGLWKVRAVADPPNE